MVAALVLAAACRPRPPVSDPDWEPPAATQKPGQRAEAVTVAVARASSPLQLLPDTTIAVLHMAGIRALLAVVDVDAIVDKYRTYYDQAVQLSVMMAGVNLLDPGQWREIGVDPDGAMGVAALDLRSSTFVGFISLSDPDKFRGFLDKTIGSRLQPVLEDRGLVLKSSTESGSAVVLRDGFALFLTSDQERAPYDFARLLASIDPARGLTATPRYQRATASGEPARPLTAYVDLWAMVQGEKANREAQQGRGEASYAEQELERLVASGGSAEDQARMRQLIDENREWERRAQERQRREFELVGRWLERVEPIVFEFTGSRTGVVGKIRAKMPEVAPARGLLRNAQAPSPLFAALGERAVMMLGGNIEVAPAIAGFEELVRADGTDPETVYRKLREAMKIDLKAEMAPLLTGAGGLALTVSEALLRGESTPDNKELGFALALAVKDVAAAQALVGKAVQQLPMKSGKDARTGAHTLVVPGYRTVYAAVTAGQVVVTTDLGVVRRLGAGTPSAIQGVDAAVVPVLTARDVAMQGMLDVVLPVLMMRSLGSGDVGAAYLEPYWVFPDVTPAQVDKVPRSRAYKAKLRAWEALNAKIRKQEQVRERKQTQATVAIAGCVGVLAANLREQPDGLELAGGQFFGPGGLGRAIDLAVDSFNAPRPDQGSELYGQRSALEEELRRIRINDVAMALHLPVPVQ